MRWPAALGFMNDRNAVAIVAGLTLALIGCARRSGGPHLKCTNAACLSAKAQSGGVVAYGVKIRATAGRLWRELSIPFHDETKHFKLIGTTGTGKSTAIRELMGGALTRGDRAVFADPDGGYCREFFDRYRGDIVLNPFEQGSVKWDLFAELNRLVRRGPARKQPDTLQQ